MLLLEPFHVGDTVTLYAPRELSCTVLTPSGSVSTIDTREKRVDIELTEPGRWDYEFSDNTEGEINVLPAVNSEGW